MVNCKTCGFDKDIERKLIFLTDSILFYLNYEHNKCDECGHQKDGSTIPVVHKTIQEISNSLIFEKNCIWAFIKAFNKLDSEERKEVCVNLPNFCIPDYKAQNMFDMDTEKPYSWNVVMIEVKSGTELAHTMVREWKRKQWR